MGDQAGHALAPHLRIVGTDEIPAALDRAGFRRGRVVVVLVGGAAGMSDRDLEAVAEVLVEEVVPLVERLDAVVIDGGTDSGVMRLIGRARSASGGRFPLVGVAGSLVLPRMLSKTRTGQAAARGSSSMTLAKTCSAVSLSQFSCTVGASRTPIPMT